MANGPGVGIDLGGTKIHAGVVTPKGDILAEARVPTEPEKDGETILANIVAAARQAMEESGVEPDAIGAVGIGCPAPLDMAEGVLLRPNNLLTLHGFPIVARLSEALGRSVRLNNDANCFGLAQARFGAGAGFSVCCGFTLGTGLGAFVVLDGRLYNGPRGAAAEIWCSPYMGDQVEQKTNGTAITRTYRKLTEREATPREIAWLARSGEEAAIEAYREYGRNLAVPVAYMCNILDPDVVILGGSIARSWDLFREPLIKEARTYINEVNRAAVRIVRGDLGDSAGMLGAAALVLGQSESERA